MISNYQKYSRLRCLLRVKGLVIGFYLGWSVHTLLIRKRTLYVKRFRGSDLFVFSTQRGYYLVAAATPNRHMVAIYQKLTLLDFILFYNSKNRHLEFLNLSLQGLIFSMHICIPFRRLSVSHFF